MLSLLVRLFFIFFILQFCCHLLKIIFIVLNSYEPIELTFLHLNKLILCTVQEEIWALILSPQAQDQ